MATFVIAHGAWSSGWTWKKMRAPLRDLGHDLWTPSYTGLGERAHLARPDIDLDTHIRDVVNVLEFEDLSDVVLVGHSYGGMVATGVADRARDRVDRLVYLDAFAPRDGESTFDLSSPEERSRMERLAVEVGEDWQVPPNPMPPDTPEADAAWAVPRRMPHPIATFREKLRLTGAGPLPEQSYVYCLRQAPGEPFAPSAERARREGWRYFELDASHNPHITMPEELAALFDRIARAPG